MDSSGNTFVGGYFQSSTTFGSTTLTSSSTDLFVAKLDKSGAFSWATGFSCPSSSVLYAVATDSAGNVYAMGHYQVSLTLGALSIATTGSFDVFVAKIDTNGQPVWLKTLGGTGMDLGLTLAVDRNDVVYVGGSFSTAMTIGSTPLTSAGGNDIFIARLDAAGNILQANRYGGTGSEGVRGLHVDASGNTYFTGSYSTTTTLGSDTYTAVGGADMLLAKLDSMGTVVWSKSIGSTGSDIGMSITTDSSGALYVTGSFSGTTTFGADTFTATGAQQSFISKLDTNGNFIWTKALGSNASHGLSIASDGTSIYATGDYITSLTLGSFTLSGSGTYLVKLSASGSPIWLKKGSGNFLDDSLDVNANGDVSAGGYFSNTGTFDGTSITSAGSSDIFIWRPTQ